MIWLGITGSWRHPEVTEKDTVRVVSEAMDAGAGVVTGGALGVDSHAMRTALRFDPSRLLVIIPTSLDTFLAHHMKRAAEGVITDSQVDDLAWLLHETFESGGLVPGWEHTRVGTESYFARNTLIVETADELAAFRVNNSAGTGDTIRKARVKGIRVTERKYTVKG